uniref:Uncharacterized protein n=1 Tax=Oryza punctata TaxID=4537 RepID=A0A0E0MAM8_ORYPU
MHTEGKNDSYNELTDLDYLTSKQQISWTAPKQALHVVNLEQQCQATRIRVWRKAHDLVSLPARWVALHIIHLEKQCQATRISVR